MDFNRLTIKSQEAAAGAQELARRNGNPEVYSEHLTLALLDQELPRTLLERAGQSVPELRAQAEATLASKPAVQGASAQQPRVSTAFSRVLEDAERRCAGSRTSTSRPSTCFLRSTSRRAMQWKTRSVPSAARSASLRRTRRARTR